MSKHNELVEITVTNSPKVKINSDTTNIKITDKMSVRSLDDALAIVQSAKLKAVRIVLAIEHSDITKATTLDDVTLIIDCKYKLPANIHFKYYDANSNLKFTNSIVKFTNVKITRSLDTTTEMMFINSQIVIDDCELNTAVKLNRSFLHIESSRYSMLYKITAMNHSTISMANSTIECERYNERLGWYGCIMLTGRSRVLMQSCKIINNTKDGTSVSPIICNDGCSIVLNNITSINLRYCEFIQQRGTTSRTGYFYSIGKTQHSNKLEELHDAVMVH